MISGAEVVRSLYGAWRLAQMDASGMAWFDTSLGGFWRSFWAAGLVLPLFLAMLLLRFSAGAVGEEVPFLRYLGIELAAYAVQWLLFPVIALEIARLFDKGERYPGFIVAYNWASVLQNGVYLPILMLNAVGLLARDPTALLALIALSLILAYNWFIARVAFDLPPATAAGVVALDFMLGLVINAVAGGMLR
ncbi:MAG: hypothetical protein H7841_13100 [Magnetospirillum sp. WYHS-4]